MNQDTTSLLLNTLREEATLRGVSFSIASDADNPGYLKVTVGKYSWMIQRFSPEELLGANIGITACFFAEDDRK